MPIGYQPYGSYIPGSGQRRRVADEDDDDWQITRGFKAGIAEEQALYGGAKAALGSALDDVEMMANGMDYYQQKMREASAHYGDVESVEDIEGVEDFLDWSLYNIGKLTPMIATSLIGGGFGGIIAKSVGKEGIKALARTAAKKKMKDTGDRALLAAAETDAKNAIVRKRMLYGAGASAATTATIPIETGAAFTNILEEEGIEAPGVSLLAGVAAGSLDAVAPLYVLGKIIGGPAMRSARVGVANEMAKRRGLIQRVLTEGAKISPIEGMIEGTQEAIQIGAAHWVRKQNNPELEESYWDALTSYQSISALKNSVAAGALGGMVFGAVGGVKSDRQRLPGWRGAMGIGSQETPSRVDVVTEDREVQLGKFHRAVAAAVDAKESKKVAQEAREKISEVIDPTAGRTSFPEPPSPTREQPQVQPVPPEPVYEPEEAATDISVSSLLGRTVTYQGVTGILTRREDGLYVVSGEEAVFIERGESGLTADEIGVLSPEAAAPVGFEFNPEDNTFVIRGKTYKYVGAQEDDAGNPVSINARTMDGKRRNFTKPEIVRAITQAVRDRERIVSPVPEGVTFPPIPATEPFVSIDEIPQDLALAITGQRKESGAEHTPTVSQQEMESAVETFSGLRKETLLNRLQALGEQTRLAREERPQPIQETIDGRITRAGEVTVAEKANEVARAKGQQIIHGDETFVAEGFANAEVELERLMSLTSSLHIDGKDVPSLSEFFAGTKNLDFNDMVSEVFLSILDLKARGMPSAAIEAIQGIGIFDETFPSLRDNSGFADPGSRMLGLNDKDLRIAADKEIGARYLRHVIGHEIGHLFDMQGNISSLAPGLHAAIEPEHLMLGDIAAELYQNYLDGTPLGQMFDYPFNAIETIEETNFDPDNTLREEIFSQAWTHFFTHPQVLKQHAPKTYNLIKDLRDSPREVFERDATIRETAPEVLTDRDEVPGDVRAPPVPGGTEVQDTGRDRPDRGDGVTPGETGPAVEERVGETEERVATPAGEPAEPGEPAAPVTKPVAPEGIRRAYGYIRNKIAPDFYEKGELLNILETTKGQLPPWIWALKEDKRPFRGLDDVQEAMEGDGWFGYIDPLAPAENRFDEILDALADNSVHPEDQPAFDQYQRELKEYDESFRPPPTETTVTPAGEYGETNTFEVTTPDGEGTLIYEDDDGRWHRSIAVDQMSEHEASNGIGSTMEEAVDRINSEYDGTYVEDPDHDVPFHPAYHGTPNRKRRSLLQRLMRERAEPFDRFEMSRMGSGEGAQAYGWGMYFTSSKKVARFYREFLTHGKWGKRLSPPTKGQIARYEKKSLSNALDAINQELAALTKIYPEVADVVGKEYAWGWDAERQGRTASSAEFRRLGAIVDKFDAENPEITQYAEKLARDKRELERHQQFVRRNRKQPKVITYEGGLVKQGKAYLYSRKPTYNSEPFPTRPPSYAQPERQHLGMMGSTKWDYNVSSWKGSLEGWLTWFGQEDKYTDNTGRERSESGRAITQPALGRRRAKGDGGPHETLYRSQREISAQTALGAIEALPGVRGRNLFNNIHDFIEEIETKKLGAGDAPGALYTVDIPSEQDLLDDEKKIRDQPRKIRRAIRNLVAELPNLDHPAFIDRGGRVARWAKAAAPTLNDVRGKDFHRSLARLLRPKEASLLMGQFGIPGKSYVGDSSGIRNYVIWDENVIDVTDVGTDISAHPRADLTEQEQSITVSNVLDGAEEVEVISGASDLHGTDRRQPGGRPTVADVGRTLDARTHAVVDGDLSEKTEANKETISNVLAHEAARALDQDGNAVDWYRESVADALAIAGEIYQELSTPEVSNASDVNARTIFTAIMAITSNGQSVKDNVKYTFLVYDRYKADGKLPELGWGKESQAMKKSFARLNDLIEERGLDWTREYLNAEKTKGEILSELGINISEENVGTQLNGSMILGPKVGAFYQNLNGNYEPITMDLWFMRTWGRVTGTLFKVSDRRFPTSLDNFRAAVLKDGRPALRQAKIKVGDFRNDDDVAFDYAKTVQGEYAKGGFKGRTPINNASNAVIKATQMTGAPQNGGDREWMRVVIREGVRKLNESRGTNIDPAAFQALIWYPEKDLFNQLGASDARSEPTDYRAEFTSFRDSRPGRPTPERGARGVQRAAGELDEAGLVETEAEAPTAPDLANLPRPTTGTLWEGMHSRTEGVFYRGIPSSGEGTGIGAIGEGTYMSHSRSMAEGFAGSGGTVQRIRVPAELNMLDADDKIMGELKAEMGFQPWEYSDDPLFASFLKWELKDKGYDGVVSGDLATGVVIFDETNFEVLPEEEVTPPPDLALHPRPENMQRLLDEKLSQPGGEAHPVERISAEVKDWRGIWDRYGQRAVQGIFDRQNKIGFDEKKLNEGKLKDGSESAYKATLWTNNLETIMQGVLYGGPLELKDGSFQLVEDSGSFVDIFQDMDKETLRDWELWASANRASTLIQEEREQLFSQQDINEILQDARDTGRESQFRETLARWIKFNRAILDLAEKAGILDPEKRATWDRDDYVPFVRFEDEGDVNELQADQLRIRKGLSGQSMSIHRLVGGEGKINPIEAMVSQITTTIDRSFKNEAMRRITEQSLDPLIDSFIEVPTTPANMSLARQPTSDLVITYDNVYDGDGNHVKHTTKVFQVTDPILLRSIGSMGEVKLAAWTKAFTLPKQVLTRGVTLDPAFMMANSIRDLLAASIQFPNAPGPIESIVKAYSYIGGGIKESLGATPSEEFAARKQNLLKIMASGGLAIGDFYGTGQAKRIRDEITRINRKSTTLDTPEKLEAFHRNFLDFSKDSLSTLWRKYNGVGQLFENASRINLYEAAIENGETHAEAISQAADILNFSMHGEWGWIRAITSSYPFINARLQGLNVLSRSIRNNPAHVMSRGMPLAVATIALYIANRDREEYEQLPDYDKDLYWHFYIGDEHFRLPKPFELGLIFGTLPEKMVEYSLNDNADMRFLWDAVSDGARENLAMDLMPQLVRPAFDAYANYDPFRERKIVGGSLERAPARLQRDPYTSDAILMMAETMPDIAPDIFKSPKKLEHMVRGYFGSITDYFLMAYDRTIPDTEFEKPILKPSQYPVIKRFYRTDIEPSKYGDIFYDYLNALESTHTSVRLLSEEGRTDAVKTLLAEHGGYEPLLKRLRVISRRIRALNKKRNKIYADKVMSAEKKTELLDKLYKQRNDIYKETVEKYGAFFD